MPTIAIRNIIGLLQGLILCFLYNASQTPTHWPVTSPSLFLPMVMVTLFVPLLIMQSIGNMRTKTLVIWATTASIILSGIAYYAVFRRGFNLPDTPELVFFNFIVLFIAHALVLSGDHDKRIMSQYTTYFDIAWK